jgi:hypothetical protein
MAAIPKPNEANLQAICDILDATDTGLTGSEMGDICGSVVALIRSLAHPAPVMFQAGRIF